MWQGRIKRSTCWSRPGIPLRELKGELPVLPWSYLASMPGRAADSHIKYIKVVADVSPHLMMKFGPVLLSAGLAGATACFSMFKRQNCSTALLVWIGSINGLLSITWPDRRARDSMTCGLLDTTFWKMHCALTLQMREGFPIVCSTSANYPEESDKLESSNRKSVWGRCCLCCCTESNIYLVKSCLVSMLQTSLQEEPSVTSWDCMLTLPCSENYVLN